MSLYYSNLSQNTDYPKTLIIRNTPDGGIWQIYYVQNQYEADKLSKNANRNGFYGITLEDYQSEHKETFPNWRETSGGKAIITESNLQSIL